MSRPVPDLRQTATEEASDSVRQQRESLPEDVTEGDVLAKSSQDRSPDPLAGGPGGQGDDVS